MSQVEILETPIKSEGDKKEYRLIKLQNGLKALLIKSHSEEIEMKETNAAASMTISVGSFDEPKEIGGLAHFLEHMVFMGNAKYSAESGFNDFVTANGGRRNAMTSDEFTMYFFDVQENALPEALDRFAQMFISPLLSKGAMQRERESVDSEYQMALSSEGARIVSVMKMLVKDDHPASFFDFGNLKTLKDEISDDDLHAALLEFYKKYVASKMYVSVQSRKSLDEIQQLVVDKFSEITPGSGEVVPIPKFNFEEIFKPDFHEKIFFVKPKNPKKAMVLTWVLPAQVNFNDCKPLTYVQGIFDNPSVGGIASYLKDKNLVLDFQMNAEVEGFGFNHQFCLARLLIELTEYGSENLEKILEPIFSYLLMLKETPIEEHRRLFEQDKKRIETNFKFYSERSAINNVRVSKDFLYYKDVDVLRTSLTSVYNEQSIIDVINAMNEMRFNILLLTDKHEFGKKEKYFETEYDDEPFPQAYRVLWENRKLNDEFYLEKPNPFEATNFTIFENEAESPKYPMKILQNNLFEVWHKLDNKFKLPNVIVEVDLVAQKFLDSTFNFTIMKIFDSMFSYHIRKKFYQASSANLRGSMVITRDGINLTFRGYNEKMEMFIEMYVKEFKNVRDVVSESLFAQFVAEMKENFIVGLRQARNLGKEYQSKLLAEKFHLDYDMLKALDQITHLDVIRFVPKLLKKLKVKVLAQGNITSEQTLKIVNILERNLEFQAHEEDIDIRKRGYQLPLGKTFLRLKSLMVDDDNSYISNIYQIGPKNLKNFCMGKMLKSFVDPKTYDYLRSKYQLGYVVGCGLDQISEVLSFYVVVLSQEHKHKYNDVQEKIDDFMNNTIKTAIDELSDEEYDKLRDAYIKELQAEVLTLDSEVNLHYNEISEEFYLFDRRELLELIAQRTSKGEFQEFFHSFTDLDKQRLLCNHTIGNEKREGGEGEASVENVGEVNVQFITESLAEERVVKNIEEFQKDLHLYPSVRSHI